MCNPREYLNSESTSLKWQDTYSVDTRSYLLRILSLFIARE